MRRAFLTVAALALTLSACDRPAEDAPRPLTEAAEASGAAADAPVPAATPAPAGTPAP